jgi:hypothetical protein
LTIQNTIKGKNHYERIGQQKLARLNLEPISATTRALKFIRLPIVQNDVIVIPQKAVLKCRKTNCLRCWKGNKVKSRIIETNGTSGLNFIVTNGLSSDEVVIEGFKLKDDVEIIPQAIASEDAQKS